MELGRELCTKDKIVNRCRATELSIDWQWNYVVFINRVEGDDVDREKRYLT